MERLLRDLVERTLRRPREAALALIALNPPLEARLLGLGIVMAASAALGTAAELLFSFVTKLDLGAPTAPVPMAFLQGALMLYAAKVMSSLGRFFGGTGSFRDALLLVVWIEFVLVLGQLLELLIMVFFPLVSLIGTLGLLGLMFWLLIQFTAALHGFTDLMKVGAGVIAVFFGSAMLFAVGMLAFGITPPVVMMQ